MKPSTYYFHIETKILPDFQICISVPLKSSQGRIQNPVKPGDVDSFENSQPLEAVNYFLKKTPPQTLNQQSESSLSDSLTSLLTMLMLNAMLD